MSKYLPWNLILITWTAACAPVITEQLTYFFIRLYFKFQNSAVTRNMDKGCVVVWMAGPFIMYIPIRRGDLYSRDSLWQSNAVTDLSVCCCNTSLGRESKNTEKSANDNILSVWYALQYEMKQTKKKLTTKGGEQKYLQSRHAMHSDTRAPDTSHRLDF